MAYTTIDNPVEYFNTVLYTGDDTTNRSITGVGFQPDWTWIKSRSNAYFHELYDAVRGFSSTTNGRVLYSNSTSAEGTPNTFNSFNIDGFTVSKQTGEVGTNGTGATFVAWNWLGANSTTSNTSGSITSTVSANTTAGFSIVSWAGNQTAGASCGHGLGVAPSVIIKRRRNGDGADNWYMYHKSLGNSTAIYPDTTDASGASGAWNSQTPTSTVFYHGSSIRENGNNMIAYCFAEIKGYSKFGSYTGNGSTDGTFVYTGFKPAWVLQKNASAAQGWQLQDNKRLGYNPDNYLLQPNASQAESAVQRIDIVSNGFKVRTTDAGQNSSGATYIYMAFAENPFVSSTGIPCTAR